MRSMFCHSFQISEADKQIKQCIQNSNIIETIRLCTDHMKKFDISSEHELVLIKILLNLATGQPDSEKLKAFVNILYKMGLLP